MNCTGCSYRRYLAQGRSMCTHKKYQRVLLRLGKPVEMPVSQYPDRCPGYAEQKDPEQVGITQPHKLEEQKVVTNDVRLTKNPQISLF